MATCTEVLAEFALKETLQPLPTSVLDKAKLMILDGVGLALAAARGDFAQKRRTRCGLSARDRKRRWWR
jgi:2-methylcitrate dehydratase PrpD